MSNNRLYDALIHWHINSHPSYLAENHPNQSSDTQLHLLINKLLIPIELEFGLVSISYGFTSYPLMRWIQKYYPGNTAPKIDQHAAMEINTHENRICKRDGAACDFIVEGYESNMGEIANFICTNLKFDRLYFYGKSKPIHISIGPNNTRYALIRKTRDDGVRVNTKSAKGDAARTLFDNL